ncbi:MAG: DUF4129 domain-containing protein [Verrucomicrobiae bacterium]|nr:DUF4129 domain-containing protein [Verrucomicrobiae bacterium]
MPTAIPRRPRQTLGDYFAIGLAPALIVVLVGSLILFLVEVLYRGDHGGRLRWTLGWFTLASVLITRIALELGSARGFLYGFALGGVTALSLIRNVEPPFAGLALLAVSWACVDRLVRDCTLIDDDDDATGEGLLDVAGLGERAMDASTERSPGRILYVQYATREARAAMSAPDHPNPRKLTRPPGLWVVGFSLAALPIFGLGQVLLPVSDTGRREMAFTCLCFYLLSAFGLLLTTSFLGLRRYLRQRRVPMPASIALSWLTRGTLTAVTMMLLGLLLPRPDAAYSLPALAERIGAQSVPASKASPAGAKAGTGPGTPKTTGDQDTAGAGTPPYSEGSGGTESGSSRNPPVENGAGRRSAGEKAAVENPPSASGPQVSPARVPSSLGTILKWLIHALFAAAALVLLWSHGPALWAALVGLWRDLWTWGSQKGTTQASGSQAPVSRTRQPFTEFRNPFLDTRLQRLSPGDLVTYSFDALQAWAEGYGIPRHHQETPFEFAQRLAESLPEIASPLHETVQSYSRLAYAQRPPGPDHLAALRQLWAFMTAHAGKTP